MDEIAAAVVAAWSAGDSPEGASCLLGCFGKNGLKKC